jgi:nicotinate-nucleotide--dimethylbenzimidazole phosphoribosyltransferase
MTADALNELAARALAPALLAGSAAAGDTLAQLRDWAAAVRTSNASTPSAQALAAFTAPRMLVVGIPAGTAIVDDGSGAEPIRAHALAPGAVAGAAQRGADAVDALVDEGGDLILLVTGDEPNDLRAALALISVFCRIEPAKLVSYSAARLDSLWMDALAGLRDARRAAVRHRASPARAAEALDCPALLSAAGAVLEAAARRTPVLLDGAVALAGAVIAEALRTGAARWCATSATGALHEGPALQRLGLVATPALPGGGAPGAAAILQLRAVQLALQVAARAALDGDPLEPDPTMPVTAEDLPADSDSMPPQLDPMPQEGP